MGLSEERRIRWRCRRCGADSMIRIASANRRHCAACAEELRREANARWTEKRRAARR